MNDQTRKQGAAALIVITVGGGTGANGQYLLLWVTGAVLATAAALLCYTVKEPAE